MYNKQKVINDRYVHADIRPEGLISNYEQRKAVAILIYTLFVSMVNSLKVQIQDQKSAVLVNDGGVKYGNKVGMLHSKH